MHTCCVVANGDQHVTLIPQSIMRAYLLMQLYYYACTHAYLHSYSHLIPNTDAARPPVCHSCAVATFSSSSSDGGNTFGQLASDALNTFASVTKRIKS